VDTSRRLPFEELPFLAQVVRKPTIRFERAIARGSLCPGSLLRQSDLGQPLDSGCHRFNFNGRLGRGAQIPDHADKDQPLRIASLRTDESLRAAGEPLAW
jgi:hypothetical protein